MSSIKDTDRLIDLGDAVAETKGTQVGKVDPLSGERIALMGLADHD